MLRLAQRMGDPVSLQWAAYDLGNLLFSLGEYTAAHVQFAEGYRLRPTPPRPAAGVSSLGELSYSRQHTEVACLAADGPVLWMLGYPTQAQQRSHTALTLAQQSGHPFTLMFALLFRAQLCSYTRDLGMVREHAETAIALATAHRVPFMADRVMIYRSWALAMQGQAEEGITQILQAQAHMRAVGEMLRQSGSLALLGEAYRAAGQLERGLKACDAGLAVVATHGLGLDEAELHRFKGEILQ